MGYGTSALINAIMLGALVKVLLETERPRLCTGIYAAFILPTSVVGLVVGAIGPLQFVLFVAVALLGAFAYFWLLNRIEPASGPWWFVMLGGILAPIVLSAARVWAADN